MVCQQLADQLLEVDVDSQAHSVAGFRFVIHHAAYHIAVAVLSDNDLSLLPSQLLFIGAFNTELADVVVHGIIVVGVVLQYFIIFPVHGADVADKTAAQGVVGVGALLLLGDFHTGEGGAEFADLHHHVDGDVAGEGVLVHQAEFLGFHVVPHQGDVKGVLVGVVGVVVAVLHGSHTVGGGGGIRQAQILLHLGDYFLVGGIGEPEVVVFVVLNAVVDVVVSQHLVHAVFRRGVDV